MVVLRLPPLLVAVTLIVKVIVEGVHLSHPSKRLSFKLASSIHHRNNNGGGWNLEDERRKKVSSSLLNLRGGGSATTISDDDDDESNNDNDDWINSSTSSSSSYENEDDCSNDNDNDNDSSSSSNSNEMKNNNDSKKSSPKKIHPIRVLLSTSISPPPLNQQDQDEDQRSTTPNSSKTSEIIDQQFELTSSSTRTISSLKNAISKTLRGRPPIDCIELYCYELEEDEQLVVDDDNDEKRYKIADYERTVRRKLKNDDILDDVLKEIYDDDDDSDDSSDSDSDSDSDNDEKDEEDDESMKTIRILIDIKSSGPPVDPNFGVEYKNRLSDSEKRDSDWNNNDLLDAYVCNAVMLRKAGDSLFKSSNHGDSNNNYDNDEQYHNDEDTTFDMPESIILRREAIELRTQLLATFTTPVRDLLLTKSTTNTNNNINNDMVDTNQQNSKQQQRLQIMRRGGARTNMKRTLQKNLNINFAETTRNAVLFILAGRFGARTKQTQLLMFMGAPLSFLLQTRYFKIRAKCCFHLMGLGGGGVYNIGTGIATAKHRTVATILLPSVLMSLLPVPYQVILTTDRYGGGGLYDDEEQEEEQQQWNDDTVNDNNKNDNIHDSDYDDDDDDYYDTVVQTRNDNDYDYDTDEYDDY